MRTPTWRFTLRDALVAIALLGLIAAGARRLWPEPPLARLPEGARLRVPTQPLWVTAVAFPLPKTPPPWPAGNCFQLSPLPLSPWAGRRDAQGYHVANMHYENFEAIARRLGLKAVEVEHRGGCFLVVDSRIPRGWLLQRPCSTCTPVPDGLLAKHADKFR